MNWVTLVILAVVGFVTWRAYVNGFVRELVSLSALILAIPVAGVIYDDLGRKLDPIFTNALLARLVAFLGTLVGVVIAGQVAAHLLKRAVAMLNLGHADRLAGGLFGFLKGVVLCQVVLLALVVFPRPDLRDDIDGSELATLLLDGAPAVVSLLPGLFDAALDGFLDGTFRRQDASAGETPPAR